MFCPHWHTWVMLHGSLDMWGRATKLTKSEDGSGCYGVATISSSWKWKVSFAEYHLFYRALLQKRPMILRSLLIVATTYDASWQSWHWPRGASEDAWRELLRTIALILFSIHVKANVRSNDSCQVFFWPKSTPLWSFKKLDDWRENWSHGRPWQDWV